MTISHVQPDAPHAAELVDVVKRFPRPVSFRDLACFKKRQVTDVLNGLNLTLEYGEILGLVGLNGSGKSTLIRLMAGLLVPDAGSLSVLGHRPTNHAADIGHGGDVGLVLPNERSFFWRLSVARNLRFFAMLNDFDPRQADACVADMLEKVGLSDKADTTFRELSDGMKQRVALARGLLTDPRLLLVDEATRSLDPAWQERVRNLLRAQADKPRSAVLLVSHNLDEILAVSDRVALLEQGRIVRIGRPADIGTDLRVHLKSGEVAA